MLNAADLKIGSTVYVWMGKPTECTIKSHTEQHVELEHTPYVRTAPIFVETFYLNLSSVFKTKRECFKYKLRCLRQEFKSIRSSMLQHSRKRDNGRPILDCYIHE